MRTWSTALFSAGRAMGRSMVGRRRLECFWIRSVTGLLLAGADSSRLVRAPRATRSSSGWRAAFPEGSPWEAGKAEAGHPRRGPEGPEARHRGARSGRAETERRTAGVTAADWAGAFLPGAASWSAQGERRGEGRRPARPRTSALVGLLRAPNSEQRSDYARVCVPDDVRPRVVAVAIGTDGGLFARRRGSPTPCAVGRRESYLVRDTDAASPNSRPAHRLATGWLARRSVLGRLLGPVQSTTSRVGRSGGSTWTTIVRGIRPRSLRSRSVGGDRERPRSRNLFRARGGRRVGYEGCAAIAGRSALVRPRSRRWNIDIGGPDKRPATRTAEAVRCLVSHHTRGSEHAGDGYGRCLKSLPSRGEMPRAAGWP